MTNPWTGRVVDPNHLRAVMGRNHWFPARPFGETGYSMVGIDRRRTLIVTGGPNPDDGVLWLHASITGPDRLPTYDEFTRLHWAVWGHGYAYQVFAPKSDHVNLHQYALHLWGRADGQNVLPTFADGGTR